MFRFDTAQICLNGHIITKRYIDYPELRKDFCEKCGESTIYKCPKCDREIPGEQIYLGLVDSPTGFFQHHFPYFCIYCGSSFPWTSRKVEALTELVKGIHLSKDEKELMITSIPDLIADNPKTSTAVVRWKKGLSVAGENILSAIKQILVEIVSEAVKNTLFS